MTAYRRGMRLEYLARDELQRRGYTVVRSAGSPGPIDLIALNDYAPSGPLTFQWKVGHGQVPVVQVRKYRQPIRPALRKLLAVPRPTDARRPAWVYHPACGDIHWRKG